MRKALAAPVTPRHAGTAVPPVSKWQVLSLVQLYVTPPVSLAVLLNTHRSMFT